MWIARLWYLLVLLGCAVGFAGVIGLPAYRDARVIEVADQAADIEAELIRNAVAATRIQARQAARLAASSPRLHAALVVQEPPLPDEMRASLIAQAVASLGEGERQFVLLGADGAILGASKGVDAASIAKDPLAKQAIKGTPAVTLRQGNRWMAAVPLPKPARGALVALVPGPIKAAVRAHGDARPKGQATRLVVLLDEKPIGGDPDRELRAALAKAADKSKPADTEIDSKPFRTRRYAVPAAPGVSVVLAWPVDAPTTFKDTGGVGAVIRSGLARMPELAIFGGLALLVWLLGLIIANLERARVLRRLAAEVDLIAAGPELEPVELGRVPSWLRGVADSANEAAASARHRMQATMQARIDQLKLAPSEVSAERPMDDPVPSRRLKAVDSSAPPARRADSSAPPARRPDTSTPAPARQPEPSTPAPPAKRPETTTPPPVSAPPPDLDTSEEASTITHTPSGGPRRSPFVDPEPSAEISQEAEGEGTQELPSRRMGAFKPAPTPTPAPPMRPHALSDVPTTQKAPSAPPAPVLDLPLPPPDDEDSLETIDHRSPLLSSTPPPAIEDAEASTDFGGGWDMSLPGLDPDPVATTDSIQLPRSSGGGSLLAQLRDKQAFAPKSPAARREPTSQPALPPMPDLAQAPENSGESTVVRPIPMALLDATSNRDPDRTAVGPAPTAPDGRDALERYYEQVYQEFLEIRRRCGEGAGGVDYRLFRQRLVRTRKTLMERFNCVDVRFRVYVKDGRAALKAAPILDEDA